MRSLLWMCAAGVLWAVPARAEWQPEIRIVEFGTYSSAGDTDDPNPTREHTGVSALRGWISPRLIEQTDRVEARRCVRFGVKYVLTNMPAPVDVEVTVRVTHPLFVRPDGEQGTEETWTGSAGTTPYLTGFQFDEAWEMAPGAWTIEIVSGGHVLAGQRFDVVRPRPGSPAAPGCDEAVS